MGKKRQVDFQKTKLRVGKTLPKGKNVTDTSFKTRKIATRDQIKSVTGELSLKDILGYLSHNNVSMKKDSLAKLTNYIIDNKDSLTLFFPDVLKRVGGMLMESDHGVRMVVIDVLHTALRLLSDSQVVCFFTSLTSYMQCMLTHCDTDVRLDSLQLLDRVLGTHPRVFCRATTILHGLLNLISSATQKGKKRRLDELISSSVSSQQMRAEVLSHILTFLECLFEKPADREDDDERETYWDAKEPLYLPLYLRGGPTPMEEADAKLDQGAANTQEFKDFVSDLLPLLFDIIKGELPRKRLSGRERTLEDRNMSDNLVDPSVVSNLNVVVQILCCVGEWMLQQTPFDDAKDKEFKDLITEMVCNQLFSYFPYQQLHGLHKQKKSETKNETTCLLLNLACSYVYCMFVLDSGTGSSHAETMIKYLEEVYNVYSGMSEKTLNLIIKINKLLMRSPNVIEVYKNGLLLGLYGVLDSHKLSACVKPLYSFLMDISLEYEFKSLLDCEAMKTWFNIILKEILIIVESDSANKRFFKYVRQICARKYPYFVDLLNRCNPDNFLDLLKNDDEELHLTITQMITCLDQPSGDILDGLIDVICDPCFSLKSATRMIRLLHARFLGPKVPDHEKLFFVKFLLNLGCDSLSLVDPSSEVIIPDMLKSVMEGCRYTIRPSDKWDRHLKITEVCFECLPCYLETDLLVLNILKFLNAALYQYTIIPIHSAVALLKLRKEAFEFEQSEDLKSFYGELLFSSLMYLSVMLSEESKGEALKPYALTELKNSLGLECEDVTALTDIIKINIHSFGESEMYHVLRMTQFLIHVNILRYEDRHKYYPILENINSTWHRSNLLHPLWTNICKFFQLI